MNITRRNFLQGLGVFSFNMAIGIPPLSGISLPAHTLYSVGMGNANREEEHIKAAYLGIGPLGLDISQELSCFLGVDLQQVPGGADIKLLAKLLGTGPTFVMSHQACTTKTLSPLWGH